MGDMGNGFHPSQGCIYKLFVLQIALSVRYYWLHFIDIMIGNLTFFSFCSLQNGAAVSKQQNTIACCSGNYSVVLLHVLDTVKSGWYALPLWSSGRGAAW